MPLNKADRAREEAHGYKKEMSGEEPIGYFQNQGTMSARGAGRDRAKADKAVIEAGREERQAHEAYKQKKS